jgi:hypothetical protein
VFGLGLFCGAGCIIGAALSLPQHTDRAVFPLWTLPLWVFGIALSVWFLGWAEDRNG